MNIVVLAIDSLRADHLGCYGYGHDTSPRINALAAQSALVERLICSSIPTHPSFTTFHTGRHAADHGIVAQGHGHTLDRPTATLAQRLIHEGFSTCAVDNLPASGDYFAKGFETIIDPGKRRGHGLLVTCEQLNDPAIRWLETRRADEPFFLMIHYWDPHTPYLPPARCAQLFYEGDPRDPENTSLEPLWAHPLGARWKTSWFKMLGGGRVGSGGITDADYVRALYDREIRYVDEGVGQVLDALDRLGMADDTLVVLYADHGESMTEHGVMFDHHGLYETNLHVPLIVRAPGKAPPRRVNHICEHQDLAAMILEAAGVGAPESMEDPGLWNVLRGEAEPDAAREVLSCECTWQAKWSLRTPTHKIIVARCDDYYGSPPLELYNLGADPAEEKNIAGSEPKLAKELNELLEARLVERLERAVREEDPICYERISMGKEAIDIGRKRRSEGA